MGAMPPPPHWIPEDDVLLKNAVEAGASLESLAKGAVQFSRRFTIQELQDRWYSLLYDPIVSEDASAHMIEVERSAFTNQPRPNRLESIKELTCSSRKRKAESVRKCYYAMRKRICNEPFDMMGINLLSGPSDSNFGDGNEFASAGCEIVNPISNNLGIQGPEFDNSHSSFSKFGTHATESIGNGATTRFSTVQNHGEDFHLGGENVHQNLSYPYEENLALTEHHGEVPAYGQSEEMALANFLEPSGLEQEGNECSQFGSPPFHNFECSSPLHQMSNWNVSPDISAAGLPMEIGEKDQQTGDMFIIPQAGDANGAVALRYGGDHSNSHLMDTTPSTDDYLEELTNTLFDFTNEDGQLFMDTDGQDRMDMSYFDGLLDSPNQSGLPNVSPGEAAIAVEGHVGISGAHPEGSDNRGPHLSYQHKVPDAQVSSSASTVKNFGPEYRNGVICCTLNTEDPDIPSNDDVFLPFRFPSPSSSSGAHWRLHDHTYLVSSSVNNFSSAQKENGGPPIMKNNKKDSHVPSCRSSQPSDMGSKHSIGDHGVKFELPKSNIHHAALRNARSSGYPNHISSATGVVNGGSTDMERGKNLDYKSFGPCLKKHDHGSGILESHQRNDTSSRNELTSSRSELDAKSELPNNGSTNVDLSSQQTIVPEPADKSLPSDQEELWSENDLDVPYSSDVETMILDMDLSPDEFDLYTYPEVQRYQHEETKRTIIRLEQAADACTQRAIAAQDAFAVLYSRCSKYFIKKPEVLLGRETEDIKVDIDLGREKNGGKISRRQALVKMDMHGMFHLKNLGKGSIYMNGKEVLTGQSQNLTSGCLIEVKGLAFVFETNRRHVKQYVGSFLLDQKPANES